MNISELIKELAALKDKHGDIEVGAQSGGCCYHVHEIISVELGGDYDLRDYPDGVVAIRV